MSKFKEGDRVRMVNPNGYKGVTTGTVYSKRHKGSTVRVKQDGHKVPASWPIAVWELIPDQNSEATARSGHEKAATS